MKRILAFLMLIFIFGLSGCSNIQEFVNQNNQVKDTLKQINNISDKARQSNIYISTTLIDEYFFIERKTGGQGSGFVYKKDDNFYYALTNFHVIDPEDADRVEYKITLNNGKTVPGTIVAMGDSSLDLAVIKLPIGDNDIALTKINPNITFRLEEFILVIGNPGGLQNVVSTTEIEGYGVYLQDINYKVIKFSYAMDAHGNSGGAVINLNGDLIGIITWQSATHSETKYAIPFNLVYKFLEDTNNL